MVGRELLTSLSAAAGVTNQLFLDSGSTLDKVGHGAGQSGVRMVPAERLPELREVRDIMFSWMRPVYRKGQYDDADWFKDNPNRAGGTVVARTDATVGQYCSYIKGILTMDWAVSNRSAVKVSAFGYPTRLVKDTDNVDKTYVCLVPQLSSRPDCDVFIRIDASGD